MTAKRRRYSLVATLLISALSLATAQVSAGPAAGEARPPSRPGDTPDAVVPDPPEIPELQDNGAYVQLDDDLVEAQEAARPQRGCGEERNGRTLCVQAGGRSVDEGTAADVLSQMRGDVAAREFSTAADVSAAAENEGALLPFPEDCFTGTLGLTTYMNRREACLTDTEVIREWLNHPDGRSELIGELRLGSTSYWSMEASAMTQYGMWIRTRVLSGSWGTVLRDTEFWHTATCDKAGRTPACITIDDGDSQDSVKDDATLDSVAVFETTVAHIREKVMYWPTVKRGIVSIRSGTSPSHESGFVSVRCDRDLKGAQPFNLIGCVLPAFVPTLQYRTGSNADAVARHIIASQASGTPGKPGGRPLQRLVHEEWQRRNSRYACGGRQGSGEYECDEYPFASTWQGAYTRNLAIPGADGRTFEGCGVMDLPLGVVGDGWSACHVLARDNGSAGGSLNAFYVRERVLSYDAFYVNAK